MARDRHKDGRDRAVGTLEGRPKALRRELSDLESELERARRRRDRAQARVEALEAIAEQLAVALAAAEAARERRRTQQHETVVEAGMEDAGSDPPVGPDEQGVAVATATPRAARRARSPRQGSPAC